MLIIIHSKVQFAASVLLDTKKHKGMQKLFTSERNVYTNIFVKRMH